MQDGISILFGVGVQITVGHRDGLVIAGVEVEAGNLVWEEIARNRIQAFDNGAIGNREGIRRAQKKVIKDRDGVVADVRFKDPGSHHRIKR